MIKRQDLRIRDPFILVDKENKCYYMYGTTDLEDHCLDARNTFTVYKSYDLESFDDGKVVSLGKSRGRKGGIKWMVEQLEKAIKG